MQYEQPRGGDGLHAAAPGGEPRDAQANDADDARPGTADMQTDSGAQPAAAARGTKRPREEEAIAAP
eukprot:COSAG04_NODE_17398_length_470_cov_0.983827_1_plen_66_part_10